MRKVSIDEVMFTEAFQRDEDFEQYPQNAYLDLDTGEILWFFVEDDDAEMWAGIDPVKVADQDAVKAYYDFRDQRIKDMAEEFLRENDIHPVWR
jgi:hypothetical protein